MIINSTTKEKYSEIFDQEIKANSLISKEKYEELKNKNPEIFKEIESDVFRKKIIDEAKSGLYQYGMPAIQIVGGGLQIAVAAGIDVVGCATIVVCGVAIGGSSILIGNGIDDVVTGYKNFGATQQTNSFILSNNGVSEESAVWIKLGTGQRVELLKCALVIYR